MNITAACNVLIFLAIYAISTHYAYKWGYRSAERNFFDSLLRTKTELENED